MADLSEQIRNRASRQDTGEVRVWAEMKQDGSWLHVPICQIDMSYEIDNIPTAIITPVIGRLVVREDNSTDTTPGNVFKLDFEQVVRGVPIRLWGQFHLTTTLNRNKSQALGYLALKIDDFGVYWPEHKAGLIGPDESIDEDFQDIFADIQNSSNRMLLFRGLVASMVPSRSPTNAAFSIEAIGDLARMMSTTSAVAGLMNSGTGSNDHIPVPVAGDPTLQSVFETGFDQGRIDFPNIVTSAGGASITMAEDLFFGGLLPVFRFLATKIPGDVSRLYKENQLRVKNDAKIVNGYVGNKGAQDILAPYQLDGAGGIFAEEGLTDGAIPIVPINVKEKFPLLGVDIASYVENSLAKSIWGMWNQSSLWDALRSVMADFQVRLISTFECVTLAPVMPVSKRVHRTIAANEYTSISLRRLYTQPIGAVIVSGRGPSAYMKESPGMSEFMRKVLSEERTGMGVFYEGDVPGAGDGSDAVQYGRILKIPAPTWLTSCIAYPAADTSEPPTADNPNGIQAEDSQQKRAEARLNSSIGDRFADLVLRDKYLQSRQMVVTGVPRFDIGPGSTVKVEAARGSIPGLDIKGDALYGMVFRVVYKFSANPPGASTVLHISHVRTEAEQNSGLTYGVDAQGKDEHPLYEKSVYGYPMTSGVL